MENTKRFAEVSVWVSYPFNVSITQRLQLCCNNRTVDCASRLFKSAVSASVEGSEQLRHSLDKMARRLLEGSAKIHASNGIQYTVGNKAIYCVTLTVVYGLRTQFRAGRTCVAFIQIVEDGD